MLLFEHHVVADQHNWQNDKNKITLPYKTPNRIFECYRWVVNLPSSVVFWMEGGRGLVPVQQYVTFSETCVVTCAFIGRVLYPKLWFLRVLFKQYWVSLFPLIPSPVLVNYLPVGLYFTSPEALSTLMHFWKPLFSKTSGFQKTDKKICVHTSIFISHLAVYNRDWKWDLKMHFVTKQRLNNFFVLMHMLGTQKP